MGRETGLKFLFSQHKEVPPQPWRGTFLYVIFNCTHCVRGHFSTTSTTSAETQEVSVKTVSDG